MKKTIVLAVITMLLVSSCGTYEGAGAYTGAQFGSIIGSAIGGITNGPRGRDVGTLAGMVSGAIVGAAIGKAADDKMEQRYERYAKERRERREFGHDFDRDDDDYDESGFDPTNSGDDRISFDGTAPNYMSATPVNLVVSKARIIDASHDGELRRGESARVVFEIHNPTDKPAYGVLPSVTEVTGNRHIHISENVLVECIQPKQTIRYTAQVKADSRLHNGEAIIRVAVLQSGRELSSQTRQYRITTLKR